MEKSNSKVNNQTLRPWGAHISIAGGVENAPSRAGKVGAHSIQIFTKNNNRWEGKPISEKQRQRFVDECEKHDIWAFASHDCYLINLAATDKEIIKKSRAAFLDEIDRADLLDIPCLVFHPGSHVGAGVEKGIKSIADNLTWALSKRQDLKTTLTLETTAGQGTSIGYRFEEIASVLELVDDPTRFGVCVDTCHIFAAGYGINTRNGYQETFREFDSLLGIDKIKMFHINDSKKELGSRVDRHEHIGKGHLGVEAFRMLVNDKRFKETPMILETPKGPDGLEDIDNLAVLQGLVEV